MSDTLARSDAKRGWSTQCRAGNCATCETIGARCAHSCHGPRGQTPPKERTMATPTGFQWEDPPPILRSKPPFDAAFLPLLREEPKRWARVTATKQAASIATRINQGKLAAFLGAGKWEAAARKTLSGPTLYVRFMGDA